MEYTHALNLLLPVLFFQTRVKLVKQSEYPYKAETGICHLFSQSHDGVLVKDFAAHDFRYKSVNTFFKLNSNG